MLNLLNAMSEKVIFQGKELLAKELSNNKLMRRYYPLSDNNNIYWIESNSGPKGLSSIIRYNILEAKSSNITEKKYNVGSKIHGYGGIPYFVGSGIVYFIDSEDQDIYQIKNEETKKVFSMQNVSIGEIAAHNNHLYFVIEDFNVNNKINPSNYIAHIDLDDPSQLKKSVFGASFYSNLKISNDGKKLLWLQWDLPNMPWESSELHTGDILESGDINNCNYIDGGNGKSIFQPEWDKNKIVYVREVNDRGELFEFDGSCKKQIIDLRIDLMKPLWVSGLVSYKIIDNEYIFATGWKIGRTKQVIINRLNNTYQEYDLNIISDHVCVSNSYIILAGSTEYSENEIMYIDIKTMSAGLKQEKVHKNLIQPKSVVNCHIYHYPPNSTNKNNSVILKVHSGPTSCSNYTYSEEREYWKTRGYGFIEIDYRGSTNFGINYRKQLDGEWGIYDTQDLLDVVNHVRKSGYYDPEKIILKGSSAGGFTILNALCEGLDVACASCYYAVSDLESLMIETHKFESGYTERLLGIDNDSNINELCQKRSPISKVDKIKTPVIFFQGLIDNVVYPSQTQKIYNRLILNDVKSKMFLFDSEGHGFKKSETIEQCRLHEEDFFLNTLNNGEPIND